MEKRTPVGVVPIAGQPGLVAYVDREDWLRVMSGPAWCDIPSARRFGNVVPTRKEKDGDKVRRVILGRFVLGAKRRQIVRYRDGNPLNCRRSNLVLQAGCVRYHPRSPHRPWEVWIYILGHSYFGGNWPTEAWAREIYDELEVYSDYARAHCLNRQQIRCGVDKVIGRVRYKKR